MNNTKHNTKHNTKSETRKTSKSRKQSPRDDEFDGQTPWPDNPKGYVLAQRQIEDFIGYQTLYVAHVTAARMMVVAQACKAIGKGEEIELNRRLVRYIASEGEDRSYRQVMKAIIAAVEQGEEGAKAAYRTARYLLEFGFEDVTSSDKQMVYNNARERMRKAAKRSK